MRKQRHLEVLKTWVLNSFESSRQASRDFDVDETCRSLIRRGSVFGDEQNIEFMKYSARSLFSSINAVHDFAGEEFVTEFNSSDVFEPLQ